MTNKQINLSESIDNSILSNLDFSNRYYQFLDQWLNVLQSPFDEHPEMEEFAGIPPQWAKTISVSCSS